MNRIAVIWISSTIQLQNEWNNYLWNAIQNEVSKIVVLSDDREVERFCHKQKIESEYLKKVSSAEEACSQSQSFFYKFSIEYYDELVFIDGDMIGPFYPLDEVFAKMQDETVDFWGLVRNFPIYTLQKETLPESIDARFLVLKKSAYRFHKSLHFFEMLFDNLSGKIPFNIAFSHTLEEAGYTGKSYCDLERFRNVRNCNNFIWYEGKACDLVKKERCPFVPAEVFAKKNFQSDDGHDARNLLEYIIKQLGFPEKYLWEKLLCSYDICDLYHGLHLDYILSEYQTYFNVQSKRAAVIIHVYYNELLDKIVHFAMNIPKWIDIYVTTSVEANIEKINRAFASLGITDFQVIKVQNRGRDCSALLVGCREIVKKYEYMCFVHDKKTSGNNGSFPVGERFMDSIFENLLGSEAYIYNILELFEKNPFLGVVASPAPVHGQYFCLKDDAWTCCFDETLKLASKIGESIKIDKRKSPFILSTSFWCRTQALEGLWNYAFTYDDFCEEPMPEDGTISHAIERIIPYLAQKKGFYSATVMTTQNASLLISNLDYQLQGVLRKYRNNCVISSYANFEGFNFTEFIHFCKRYKRLYIYGIGLYGRKYAKILSRNKLSFAGFIVTSCKATDIVCGQPVYTLDEFLEKEKKQEDKAGIAVAVSVYYQEEIGNLLKQRGINDFYII